MARAGTSESVDASRPYPTLGVKSHAQGAFDSGVLQGASTAYKTLTQLQAGWLVYPKLMAWEGALAVVPTDLGGRWVTPEFVAYDVKGEALSREYLRHLIAWSGFLDWVRAGSAGTNVRRRRLQPAAFEAILIPLPSRSDQDLIAMRLSALAVRSSASRADRLLSWLSATGSETSCSCQISWNPSHDASSPQPTTSTRCKGSSGTGKVSSLARCGLAQTFPVPSIGSSRAIWSTTVCSRGSGLSHWPRKPAGRRTSSPPSG